MACWDCFVHKKKRFVKKHFGVLVGFAIATFIWQVLILVKGI